ncbi:ribonuclease M5 [Paenibacillus koleovorans]|uniref:ribonuclease M5 n=1 Tax=Paenibacillus koleovorans TaxID=121608 RepID=UPI000FDAD262|nr:ribonuclease M5 [Paenibacillus koleovorans]
MIKEIIVVEGRDDTVAIRRAVLAETIETGGSAIDASVLKKIALAQERRGVIVFTDPDHAGERIRNIIKAHVPGCKHAFLTREAASRRGDIGVENASDEAIREALANVKTDYVGGAEDAAAPGVTQADLMVAGLLVHPDAAGRRLLVGERLGIGCCNGKQFLKRCAMFRITKAEFEEACRELTVKDRETNHDNR